MAGSSSSSPALMNLLLLLFVVLLSDLSAGARAQKALLANACGSPTAAAAGGPLLCTQIVRLPTGAAVADAALNVQYAEVTTCDAIRKATALDADKIAAAVCPCLTKAQALASDFGSDAAATAGPTGPQALAAAAEVEACLAKSNFPPKNDATEVRAALREGGRDVVFEAAPVDRQLYASVAAATAGCAAAAAPSSAAACGTLADLLARYFPTAAQQVGGDMAKWLRKEFLGAMVGGAVAPLKKARAAANALAGQLAACSSGGGSGSGSSPAAAKLAAAAQDLRNAFESLDAFVFDADALLGAVGRAADALETAYTGGMPGAYAARARERVQNKAALPDLSDGLAFMVDSSGLKAALRGGGGAASSSTSAASSALSAATAALDRLESLAQEASSSAPSSPAPGCGSADLSATVKTLKAKVKRSRAALGALAAANIHDADALEAGVAAYRNWADVAAELPCSRAATREFSASGLRAASAPYPEFFRCSYAARVPLPSDHIAYVRLKRMYGGSEGGGGGGGGSAGRVGGTPAVGGVPRGCSAKCCTWRCEGNSPANLPCFGCSIEHCGQVCT